LNILVRGKRKHPAQIGIAPHLALLEKQVRTCCAGVPLSAAKDCLPDGSHASPLRGSQ